MASQNRGTSKRGFASMDPEKQRQIASKGGKASHERGTAHEFTSEEASRAGRKAHAQGNAHEWTSEEARIAGRKGGQASGGRRAANANLARRQQQSAQPQLQAQGTEVHGSRQQVSDIRGSDTRESRLQQLGSLPPGPRQQSS